MSKCAINGRAAQAEVDTFSPTREDNPLVVEGADESIVESINKSMNSSSDSIASNSPTPGLQYLYPDVPIQHTKQHTYKKIRFANQPPPPSTPTNIFREPSNGGKNKVQALKRKASEGEKDTNEGISTNENLESPCSSSVSSSSQSTSPVSIGRDRSSYCLNSTMRSPSFSAIKTCRELLKFAAEDMQMAVNLRLPNGSGAVVTQQGRHEYGHGHSHGDPDGCCQNNHGSSSETALIQSQQQSFLLAQIEVGTKKIDSLIELATTFSQMEKEKIAIKKRTLTVMECHQKQVLELEREKLDIEREKLKYKKIKMAYMQSENLTRPTPHYCLQNLSSSSSIDDAIYESETDED